MPSERLARITWSRQRVQQGLPAAFETIDPAWFGHRPAAEAEGWSLVCRYDEPPRVQGNPTRAWVRFLASGAPHDRLAPGAVLRMFEPGTGQLALVEVLDD
jgi:hypothetical protein